ncbi:MAG: hypothetical protein QNJ97_22895 [Myxococcota bacterium]|nr:hypothetical protein [Myxococcota bacterium]
MTAPAMLLAGVLCGCEYNGVPLPNLVDDSGQVDTGTDTNDGIACSAGVFKWEICWIMGELNQNCNDACEPWGGYHSDASQYIGSVDQTGDINGEAMCTAIIVEMGYSETIKRCTQTHGMGLGCHLWRGESFWWCEHHTFDPTYKDDQAQLVCGCRGDEPHGGWRDSNTEQ